jgi:hypothetical protein
MIISETRYFNFAPSKLNYITSNLKIKNSQIVYANGKDNIVYEIKEVLILKLALNIKFPIMDSITREPVSHTYFYCRDQSTRDKCFNLIVQTLRSQ